MRASVRVAVTAWFLLSGLLLGLPVAAHHAPSGWLYPSLCCGGQDCSPLEAGDIRFMLTDDGTPAWLVVLTGEVIPANETRASPDRMNHRCTYLGGDQAGMTRKYTINGERQWCLWIAGGSF